MCFKKRKESIEIETKVEQSVQQEEKPIFIERVNTPPKYIRIKVPAAALREGPGFTYTMREVAERLAIFQYTAYENGWYKLTNGLYVSDEVVTEVRE